MTTIRKVLIPSYGDVDVLQIVTETIPPPPHGHIQVAVLYAGFSGADIAMRRGLYPMQKSAPLTPGYCLIGRVTALGTRCTAALEEGDLVASLTVDSAQAERINLPEKHLMRVSIPGLDTSPNVDRDQDQGDGHGQDKKQHQDEDEEQALAKATALILDWCTAWGMVKQSAQVKSGQRVFVHGVSGAVGFATSQLCRMLGASVYGTASEANHAFIRAAGGIPFVYTDKAWINEIKKVGGVHAVFDPLGFESFDESYSILSESESGVVVGYGGNQQILEEGGAVRSPLWAMGKLMLRNLNVCSTKRTRFYVIKRGRELEENLKELLGFWGEKKIEVVLKKVWVLDEVREAHRTWGKGGGVGSMVIRVG